MQKESNQQRKKIAVILMTYGSATTAEHVREYMDHIYRGKAPDGIVLDFEARYRLIGHSPLVEITHKQAELLETALNSAGGSHYIVRSAMLHSKPFISDVVLECKNEGATYVLGVILSPQFSSFIMDGYSRTFAKALTSCDFKEGSYSVAQPWPVEEHFISLLKDRVMSQLAITREKYGKAAPVVFTTHSLPKRVVDKDPTYLDQLQSTIDAVLKKLTHVTFEYHSAYQSAGHTPEEWLKPDLVDILALLKKKKNKAVIIAPIQFLADHLEILYDLDSAGRKQCEDMGIAYHRIELPNLNPLFIESLKSTVLTSLKNS